MLRVSLQGLVRGLSAAAPSRLERRPRNPGLADDREQRPDPNSVVIRYGNGGHRDRRLLHHDMTAAPADFQEAVSGLDLTNLAA